MLGGHLHQCSNCHHEHRVYNSCLNRHCPTCQASRQATWVRERMDRVLPVRHFHVVFTMPEQLRGLARANPKCIYGLLFKAAKVTLAKLAEQRMDAQLGVTAVLHTWTREMHLHPHVHCVVTAGGLSLDGQRWVATRGDYLFPVKLMGAIFRRHFMKGMQALLADGKLSLVGPAGELANDEAMRRLINRMYRTKWVVYAKKPFAGPSDVFSYLGRYTHRVAISDYRLPSDFREPRRVVLTTR